MNSSNSQSGFFPEALSQYPWAWEVFILVLLTLVASYLARIVFNHIREHVKKTKNLWDDSMLEAAHKPALSLIWIMGFSLVLDVLLESSSAVVFQSVEPLRAVLVVIIMAWYLVRVIHQVENRLISAEYSDTDEPIDETTVMALGKLVRVAVVITAVLVLLQTLGYSISGVLAFGGVGGIAVGFAAKDMLANFFGGLMIYLDRPFAVGDWVRSPDQEIEGTVEKIGWRQTCIRTFDKRPLYVPNATFSSISVENPSRMLNRRIFETIGIRYDDAEKMRDIVADVKSMLGNHPDIDQNNIIIVNFNAFAPSSLDFFVYTFTRTTDWLEYHEVKQRVLLEILDIIVKHGADVAYPTSTLKLPEEISVTNSELSSIKGGA
jgi:MscS family membrane protein